MDAETVGRHFLETGALLEGHFKLSSGLHSDRYLQCARVLQWPDRAGALGAALAELLRDAGAQVVLSPAMGGLIIGHEVGRGLGVRALFAERVEGAFELRRGFVLDKGERVAVIEDVVTTGKSTREVLDLVRSQKAEPVVCGAIVDRRGEALRRQDEAVGGLPLRALLTLEVSSWDAALCPLCGAGRTIIAPGSRFMAR